MEKRKNMNESSAIAALDPLLQPFDDQTINSIDFIPHPSSISPTTDIKPNFLRKCFTSIARFSGIIYAILASLLFIITNFLMKKLDVDLLAVFLIRFGILALIAIAFIIHKGYHPFYFHSHGLLFFLRSIAAASASICFYIALERLPLSDLTTLYFTQVVWTALLAFIIFRERLTIPTIIGSVLTLTGVICYTQPTFIFTKIQVTNTTLSTSSNEQRSIGIFVAILCSIFASIAVVLSKMLLQKKVRQSIMILYFILITFLMLLIIEIYRWRFSNRNQQKFTIREIYFTRNFLYATILATLQLIPMVLIQKSIKREHPSIFTIAEASEILFALILQNLFSNEKSNRIQLIGSALVLTSIVIVGGHKFWQDRQKKIRLPISMEENK